jgi:putative ABC transport system permease protein
MAVPLARRILTRRPLRLLTAAAAVGFAVLVMFMQVGFYYAFGDSQALLTMFLDADLVLMNPLKVHLNKGDRFTRAQLGRACSVPGIVSCYPLYVSQIGLENKEDLRVRTARLMAFPPNRSPLRGVDPSVILSLRETGSFAFDRRSRPIYGPLEVGSQVDTDRQPMRLSGMFDYGPNFSVDGTVLLSEGSWLSIGHGDPTLVAYGIVHVGPGVQVTKVQEAVSQATQGEVMAQTPGEMHEAEVRFLNKYAPLGAVFGSGLVIGLVVGVVICYQVLFNEITDQIAQYATLMAMGFGSKFITRLVLKQSVLLSFVGFLPGIAASLLLFSLLRQRTGLLLMLTPERVAVIFVLTVLMSIIAGLLAARKALSSDPADLF